MRSRGGAKADAEPAGGQPRARRARGMGECLFYMAAPADALLQADEVLRPKNRLQNPQLPG